MSSLFQPHSRGRETRESFILQVRPQQCPFAAASAAGFLLWELKQRGEEGGRGGSHGRGLGSKELNFQAALQLCSVWEQEFYSCCPCFTCSQAAAKGFSTASGAALRARVCWDVAGSGTFGFSSVVIGSFLPFSRKGRTCLICPAHLTTDQRQPGTGGAGSVLGEAGQEKNLQLLLWSPELLCYR